MVRPLMQSNFEPSFKMFRRNGVCYANSKKSLLQNQGRPESTLGFWHWNCRSGRFVRSGSMSAELKTTNIQCWSNRSLNRRAAIGIVRTASIGSSLENTCIVIGSVVRGHSGNASRPMSGSRLD